MNPLYKQATLQGIFGTFLFIALIFWPAGTFHYWQGWVFLATFAASTVGFTVYLAIYDKPLLERRLKAGPQHEKERSQRHLLNQEFMQALLLNFRHEGKRAIEKVARNQPAAYLKILALLVPREMQIEHTNRIKQMTD